MIELSNLKNTSKTKPNVKRVGRGPGSGRGKTSGRGEKGAGSRSGYRRRYGYEGGQMRIFKKLPHKGFTRGRFDKIRVIVNLDDIQKFFNDGETVNLQTIYEKGLAPKNADGGLKILGNGELSKKVIIEANAISESVKAKLDEKKISYKII
jgi:large subunit ribosomal protein L15